MPKRRAQPHHIILRSPSALTQGFITPMHNGELKAALGLNPKRHLPSQGVPPTPVPSNAGYGPILVKVLPHDPTAYLPRRTLAECPICRDWFCAGHIHQHMAVHDKDDPMGEHMGQNV